MKYWLVLVALLACVAPAKADTVRVVSSCAAGVSPALATGADTGRLTVDTTGRLCSGGGGTGGFPASSTPLTGNASGTTAAVVGTLTSAAGQTAYICGFNVSAVGGTATVGPIVVAGLTGSSQNYEMNSAATPQFLTQSFNPCIPASAANTNITVTTTANGTATSVRVNTWGFRQ